MDINNPNPGSMWMPKWLVVTLGVLLIIFVAMLIAQKGNDLKTAITNQKPANTISVSADGKVTATPDLATVSLGVMSQGLTAQAVKDSNDQKINTVINFIKAQGVDGKDIQTSDFNLYPQYNYQSGTQQLTGYQLNQTVTVKIHGVDKDQTKLENIVDGAVNNGANVVNNVSLSIEDPTGLQQDARKQAIDNAKAKAEELAKEAGLSLGKVVSISETNSYTPGPIPFMAAPSMGLGNAAKSVAPDIQPGSQDITESMTVTFEVK